jgi:hypothetical protein
MFKSDKHLAEPSESARDSSSEKELTTRPGDHKPLNTAKVAIDTISSGLSKPNRYFDNSLGIRPKMAEGMSNFIADLEERFPNFRIFADLMKNGGSAREDLIASSSKDKGLNQKLQEAYDECLLTKTDGMDLSQKEAIFDAVVKPSYQEVLDSSGKVIFTENDHRYYQHNKDQIAAFLYEEHSTEELLDRLQQIPFLKDLYGMSVGVKEGYTLEQHTSMVLGQFEKYQLKNWASSLLTAKEFQLMLAVHDIGKPQCVKDTGSRSKQHEYNGKIVGKILPWLGIDGQKGKLILALTKQDHLGDFLRQASRDPDGASVKARPAAENIAREAREIGIGAEDYFDLITRYYRADAGSYPALGRLFEAETEDNCTGQFARPTQENYDILAQAVKVYESSLNFREIS